MSGNLRAPQKLWEAAVLNVGDGGSKATLLINPAGSDNELLFTAVAVGSAGNAISITVVKDAVATQTVAVVGSAITIHIATNGSTTANALITLVNNDVSAGALVQAALVADESGAGFWTAAIGLQSLAGGVDSLNSAGGNIGPATNVNLFIKVDKASTFKVQTSASKAPSSGRNAISTDNADWYDYLRAEALDETDLASAITELVFGGAGSAAVDLSPFAPTFIRLVATAGTDVTVTAFTVSVG